MYSEADLNADYYDHLPDGTILDKIPYDDPDRLVALLQERMTPEEYTAFVRQFLTLAQQRDPEQFQEAVQKHA